MTKAERVFRRDTKRVAKFVARVIRNKSAKKRGGVILVFPTWEERNEKTQKKSALPELRNNSLEDV